MRLRAMLSTIEEELPAFTLTQAEARLTDNSPGMRISGLKRFREALDPLRDIPALTDTVNSLAASRFLKDYDLDHVIVSSVEGSTFLASVGSAKNYIQIVSVLLGRTIQAESDRTLAILIPGTESLDQIALAIAPVSRFLTLMVGLHYDETDATVGAFEFDGFDQGTDWVVVTANASGVLTLLGLIMRHAREFITWSQDQWNTLQHMKMMKEDTANWVQFNASLQRVFLDKCANDIKTKTKSKADPEELNKIMMMLKFGAALEERRYEMQVSRKALPAAKLAFPPKGLHLKSHDDLQLTGPVDEVIKLLGAGKPSNDTDDGKDT